ncbi:MAG TPA: T9SS type A sorting domain-containing protein [Flavobacteriales bacterium]|nr:T9SS type A sorting domain-containing protein [Flavobacteriales bacterium]
MEHYNNEDLPADLNVPQTASGRDWYNDVCLVRDAVGAHVGYAVCGYSYIPNYFNQNGDCPPGNTNTGYPNPTYLETFEQRWGTITGTVACYDLAGNRLWMHTYLVGSFDGIIQDKNGDLVVAGFSEQMAPWPNMPGTAQPFYYNPTVSQQEHYDVAEGGCDPDTRARKMVLMKVDRTDGHALWNHYYGPADDPVVGMPMRTQGSSVAEVDPDGVGGYRVVGYCKVPIGDQQVIRDRPFLVDVDVNGMLNWKQVMDSTHPSGLWPDSNLGSQAFRIVRHPDPAQDKYLITGVRYPTGIFSAFLLYYNDNGSTPAWWADTDIDEPDFDLSENSACSSNRACFAVSGGTTSVIWPVLSDHIGAWWGSADHTAVGRVYKLDLNGDLVWNDPVNLGWMRGFDHWFSANQRANGNIILGCTKSIQSASNPLTFNSPPPAISLPLAVQNCLQTTFGYDPVPPLGTAPDPFDWTQAGISDWGYWLSDSYMAEVDLDDGSVVWEGTWDADAVDGVTPVCNPDNIRQRQCSFNVIEADDGGLVSCGNTGKNNEDGYLIKFNGCESDPTLYATFHASHPYDPSNVYTLTANETWGSSMNVRGSVVVPAGKTLLINNNAVISFADSRRIGYTTNIVVQPGGALTVTGGARLTNIGPCGNGMWDGIKALGNTNNPNQNSTHQSTIQISGDAIIENAFVAVLAANADINDPVGSVATDRGARVFGVNATFRNNIYDVVLRPYNTAGTPVTNFQECDFLTTGPLNYPDRTPKTHLYVNAYPRLNIHGCTFENTSPSLDQNQVAAWGKGIEGFNTDLRILPLNGRDPHFTSLEGGCFAANANAKPVFVDGAFFTGCGHGLGIVASGNARVVNCEFKEPDLDMVGQGLGAPVYGSYLDGTTTILFEHNSFWAAVNDLQPPLYGNPLVGSTFKDLGGNSNRFFDNSYYGFKGTNGVLYSAGATIQGVNDGQGITDGLQFKCNQFSYLGPGAGDDDFDLAFTGPNVSVGGVQGSGLDPTAPAGNTFLMSCTGEAHMKLDDVPNNNGLYFQYWHHAPTSGVEVVPTCLTNPPLIPSGLGTINQPTTFLFDRSQACGSGAMMMMASGGANAAEQTMNAANESTTLKAAYDDWTDGGDTEGLLDFVVNPANDSYHIRNELMLVAPKVSSDIWKLVFTDRFADMNPWHLAQALIANSPLEPEVYRMMDESDLTPFYKQLVSGEQGGGMNMQTIMESELAYWMSEQSEALTVYTALAIDEDPTVSIADAIAMHQQYPVPGSDQQIYLLHLANNDVSAAQNDLNTALANDHDAWWDVQAIHLTKVIAEEELESLSVTQESTLHGIAEGEGPGASAAAAWLATSLGERPVTEVILPGTGTRSFMGGRAASGALEPNWLVVYPNPTKGDAYLTYRIPEGATVGAIEVRDATGRIVRTRNLRGAGGIEELPKSVLPPGLYTVALRADGILVGAVKFISVR